VYLARSKDIAVAKGEAVSPSSEKFLHDALTIPDLAAVEASFNRGRLLLQSGADVAAMGLEVAQSIQATNSLEKAGAPTGGDSQAGDGTNGTVVVRAQCDSRGEAGERRRPMHGRVSAWAADNS